MVKTMLSIVASRAIIMRVEITQFERSLARSFYLFFTWMQARKPSLIFNLPLKKVKVNNSLQNEP